MSAGNPAGEGNGGQATPESDALHTLELLAGGIAHDFNNLLHAVRARISLAMRAGVGPEVEAQLKDALRYTEDAEALSVQLRLLSRREHPKRTPVNIAELVSRALGRNVDDSRITCRVTVPEAALLVEADETQLSQLFSNLLRNAVEAMPNGGSLTVEVSEWLRPRAAEPAGAADSTTPADPTDELDTSEDAVETIDEPSARWVHVRVSDSGIGIEPAVLSRIFEPNFTTKPTGTGLGLAICQRVARQHGGTLTCESTKGQGTSFELMLPAQDLAGESTDR